MFKRIYEIGTIIVTAFGLVSIPIVVYQSTNSAFLTILVSVIIILILIVPIIAWSIKPGVFAEYNIGKTSNIICTQSSHLLEVQRNGEGKRRLSRTLIFLKLPEQKDLRDLFALDRPFPPKNFCYFSPDSDEIERMLVDKNHIAIVWSPKNKIYPFESCDHTAEWIARTSHADPGNYTLIDIDLQTGYHKTVVKTPYRIEHVMAFKGPRWKKLSSEINIYKYGFKQKVSTCPQPRLIDNGYGFEWEIHTPELGRTYFCTFFKEEGVKYWKREINESRISYRILRFMREALLKRFLQK